MARGKSGRVVLEIDPELKRQLYATLEHRQLTMKDWFVMEANGYIRNENQLSLFAPSTDDSETANRSAIADAGKQSRTD